MIKKGTILIADDDTGILDVITLILEDEGYTVIAMADGMEVRNISGQLPDLILLDIWMSGMDGRDICLYLKSRKETSHIPIVMVSANKDAKNIASQVKANDFIEKPFDLDLLLAMVEKYIK